MRGAWPSLDVRRQPLILAACFVALGLAAFAFNPAPSPVPTATPPLRHLVAAAKRDLPAGSVLQSADVKWVASRDDLSQGPVLGQVITRAYRHGDIIKTSDLANPASLGIAAHVPPGQRAFAIRVTDDDIVGGLLQSGDHVDAFATLPSSIFGAKADVQDRSRTILLLQDLLVLAVGDNTATHGSVQTGARTVSLSVYPDALARLALAQRFGKVSLAIRKPGDDQTAPAVSATLADLVPAAPVISPSVRRRPAKAGISFYAGARATVLAESSR